MAASASSSSSPCGACKFLRRKCVNGCIFAPYFRHELGTSHFSAVHKVFGASNASKLLAHLPVSHRCEAAITISYEAQARLQDPIYGCVSHIFTLQQQVLNLRAQVAYLREQAAQILLNNYTIRNPNELLYGKSPFSGDPLQDLQSWLLAEDRSAAAPEFEPAAVPFVEMSLADPNVAGDCCCEEIIVDRSIFSLDVQINGE
ncbi:LOB domain-containing protein 29-like [Momordica charantia]|uniref:LOB domain-containing protein 29-like n=1 Tax=Momordica charantia TaxID=3673 RepID=A0A6J1DSE8_MOMCH|nr:LOB domain-containing protein 29-like [Momordica charantia]